MSYIFFLAVFAVVFVLFPFVVGPIAVYLKHRTPARRTFIQIPEQDVLYCTSPAFAQHVQAITELGFTRVANLHSPGGQTKMFMTILRNDATRDFAHVTEIVAFMNGSIVPVTRLQYMEFATEFENGLEIDTNNSVQPGVFSEIPLKRINRLAGIEDPALVYSIHRSYVNGVNSPLKTLPEPGMEVDAIHEGMAKDLERQRSFGFLKFDSATDNYSPTVKGAVIMTWRLVWPVGAIRRQQMYQNAKRLAATHSNGRN